MKMEEITAETGVARLARPDAGGNTLLISGVAIGEDEVTAHPNGEKLWPGEQLMAAVDSLKGVQLTKNHEHDRVEGVIGRVTDARYKEGVGVLFEAEVHDEDVAQKIEEGLLEVSVHAIHANGGWTEDGEMIVEDVEFQDLSVVPRGAASSNEVRVGSLEPAILSEDRLAELMEDEFTSYDKVLTETASEFDIELEQHTSERDVVYEEYHDEVNMTAAELRSWSENPCSREASIRPTFVIRRNLRLLTRSKDDWTENDVSDARRTVSFISRMKENRPDGEGRGNESCPSKWASSLLNWAYNPFDSLPDIPEDMEPVDEVTLAEDDVDDGRQIEEELSEIHEVEYRGTEEDDWEAPNLGDFPEDYFGPEGDAKFDLVDNHFLYSETQFPPERYTDLKFPVVSPEGMLNLAALRAAKSRAPQADIPAEDVAEIQRLADELANEEFDKDWSDTESENVDETTMTEEETENEVDVEALEARVEELEAENESLRSEVQAVRAEYAEVLAEDSAFSAEELAEKFTVEELAEKYEESDAELAEDNPAPQTGGMEETEASEDPDPETQEEIATLEVQIDKYESMGWESAKESAEAQLAELVDEDDE